MQMVDERGKPASTNYEVIEVKDNMTRVHFYPVTVSLSSCCSYFDNTEYFSSTSLMTIGAHASIEGACITLSRP